MAFLGCLAAVENAAHASFVKMQNFRIACPDDEKAGE